MKDIIVEVEKLNKEAKIPTVGTVNSAGHDMYVWTEEGENGKITIRPYSTELVPTGLKMAMPEGCVGLVFIRSGVAVKRGLSLANGVAVVDSDYRGEWFLPIRNNTDQEQHLYRGDRIAQVVFLDYYRAFFKEVTALSSTDRGEGGFGSTGDK